MRLANLMSVLLLVLAAIHLVGGPAAASDRRVLSIAYDSKESWPWHLGTESVPDTMPGLSIEYMQETARRMGLEIRLIRAPFRRALAMLKEGEVDGVFEASYRPERLEFGAYPVTQAGDPDPSKSMFLQSYVFYVRATEDRFLWNGNKIEGVTGMIGVLRNTSAAADLTGKGYPVFEVGDNVRALEMLSVGRLDVVLLLDNIGTAVFSRRPDLAKNLRVLNPPWDQKPYFLMLSHKIVAEEPDFAAALWSELAAVARSPFAAERFALYERSLQADREKAWSGTPPNR